MQQLAENHPRLYQALRRLERTSDERLSKTTLAKVICMTTLAKVICLSMSQTGPALHKALPSQTYSDPAAYSEVFATCLPNDMLVPDIYTWLYAAGPYSHETGGSGIRA